MSSKGWQSSDPLGAAGSCSMALTTRWYLRRVARKRASCGMGGQTLGGRGRRQGGGPVGSIKAREWPRRLKLPLPQFRGVPVRGWWHLAPDAVTAVDARCPGWASVPSQGPKGCRAREEARRRALVNSQTFYSLKIALKGMQNHAKSTCRRELVEYLNSLIWCLI